MNIIGINLFCYNPSTALIVNDELIFFSEEERYNRLKNSFGVFPILSLKDALKTAELELSNIDIISIPWRPYALLKNLAIPFLIKKILSPFSKKGKFSTFPYSFSLTYKLFPLFLENLIKMELLNNFKTQKIPKIDFLNHHKCHAASSHCLSGFDQSLSMAFDGVGDRECSSSWFFDNSSSKKLHEKKFSHSLGEYYAGFTELFGFKAYQDEGKLMALASYGKKNEYYEKKIEKILKITLDGYEIDNSYFHFGSHSYGYRFTDKLVENFGGPFTIKEKFDQDQADLAWSVQKRLEKAVMSFIAYSLKLKDVENLCFSGGVSHNCKLMGEVSKKYKNKKIFIVPASSDSGTAIGAAYISNNSTLKKTNNSYLNFGKFYSDNYIEELLENNKIKYEKMSKERIIAETAVLLQDNLGAIFSGQSESGSRSLCFRSIIANPIKNKIKDLLNQKIKFRENWRPFGISIMADHANDYLKINHSNPHMMMAYDVKDEKHEFLKNVIHVDKTSRPQFVYKDKYEDLYLLIQKFYEITGCPAIINTSLNIKGEPIVENPRDAIKCFMGTSLDFMILNFKYLIRK